MFHRWGSINVIFDARVKPTCHLNGRRKSSILEPVVLGWFVILLLRIFIGLETIGTFMPVLIALAFRDTQLVGGAPQGPFNWSHTEI